MRDNLGAALVTRLEKTGALRINEAERVPVSEAVALLVRERLTGRPAPGGVKAMLDLVRANIEAKAGARLDALAGTAGDQEAFARKMHEVLRALDLDPGDGRGEDASEDPGDEEPDPRTPPPTTIRIRRRKRTAAKAPSRWRATPTISLRTKNAKAARTAPPPIRKAKAPTTAPSFRKASSRTVSRRPTTVGPWTSTVSSPPPSTR